MFLRRLEIAGFKSFADPVRLEFEPGITAVVGPNGSGKSNISEAIRWVLGEQNPRELRGTRMEDVIFSGSVRRKPLGLAEVALTLDNSDGFFPIEYAEVTLSRSVDRSGTSDYFLNRAPVRQRDIAALLSGTGVGRGAYAFIGQGRVEEMITSRPEERRPIFEEAAGVARHKQRKAEADRFLQHADAHLTRLRDILSELERHLAPLAEEAERAERHRRAEEELRRLEAVLLAGRAKAAARRVAALRGEIDRLAGERGRREKELSARQEARDRFRSGIEALEREIDALGRALTEAAREEERVRGAAARARDRAVHLEAEEERLRSEMAGLAERRREWEAGDAEEAETLARLEAEAHACRERLAAAEAEVGLWEARHVALESELQRTRDDLFEAMSAAARARNEAASSARERAHLERDLERCTREAEDLAEESRRLEGRLEALGRDEKAAEAGLDEHRLRGERLAAERARLEREAEAASARAARAREGVQARRTRLDLLREWEDSLEGYARGPRRVLRGKADGEAAFAGVIGAVAALVRPAAGLEAALEAALGPAVQHLVVEREEDARRAIEHLRRERAGRATFLPLDTLRPSWPQGRDAELGRRPESLGWAADLVEYDPRLRPAVLYLLGRVLVAPDLPAALDLARAAGYRYRVVTRDGDVIHPGGAVTGGASPGGSEARAGLLARAGEIERLAAAVSAQEAELARLVREAAALRASALAAASAWEEAAEGRRRESLRLEQVRRDLDAVRGEARRLEERRVGVAARREELERALAGGGAGASAEVAACEAHEAALRGRAGALEQEAAAARRAREAAAERLVRERVVLASLEQDLQGRRRWSEGLRVRREEVEREIAAREKALAGAGEERERALAEAARAEAAAAAHGGAKAEREAALAEAHGRREALHRAWAEEEASCGRCREALRRVEERLRGAQVEEARAATETRALLTTLASRFGLDEAGVMALPDPDRPGEVEERTARLREELEALGPVNPRAPEEFRLQEGRRALLRAAVEDLEAVRERLGALAARLDAGIESAFAATVQEVRHHFQDVFTRLFGGGRADLALVDREAGPPGVEVAVQPPGKKLSHLSLLSGGEKALAAIALLFALLRVRPAPFCVLDEIDAALDEANVQRLARFLRDAAAGAAGPVAQFILITHQKVTMEAADRLFGVTLDENGCSRLVSVRLGEPARSGVA